MLGPAPDVERWEAVIERKNPSCDTIRPTLTAYGVRTGDEILWVHTATDLTAPETRERYRRRCQLMAAAPELLEAARKALIVLQLCCRAGLEANTNTICKGDCDSCDIQATQDLLYGVIAKAEGRDADERDAD